ncbi:hypothetical protein ACLOJK_013169 [Asimina triloba]
MLFLLNTSAGANPNPNKSFEVVQPPDDAVSSLSFSPKGNYLVATSWDSQALCSTWKDDGATVFSGGCDKQVKMWPVMSGGQPVTVAMHDAPIKEIAWIPEMNLLVSGSWDKTLKYWDTRQQNPVHTQQLPDRCYALTVRHPLMTEYKRIISPLKYQTRCLAAFPDQQGFLVHHTFATAGSDGAFSFWDKDSKQRLKAMSRCSQPIPSSTFNNDGSIFAYAVCYDWSKGAENHNLAAAKTSIFLHMPQESEVKGKPRVGGRNLPSPYHWSLLEGDPALLGSIGHHRLTSFCQGVRAERGIPLLMTQGCVWLLDAEAGGPVMLCEAEEGGVASWALPVMPCGAKEGGVASWHTGGVDPHDALLGMHREGVGRFAPERQKFNKRPQADLRSTIHPFEVWKDDLDFGKRQIKLGRRQL